MPSGTEPSITGTFTLRSAGLGSQSDEYASEYGVPGTGSSSRRRWSSQSIVELADCGQPCGKGRPSGPSRGSRPPGPSPPPQLKSHSLKCSIGTRQSSAPGW